MRKPFEFVILGAGASAFAAAIRANELGARTAMIRGPLPIGGTCVNVGCVPSKTLIRAAELVHLGRTVRAPGLTLALKDFNFAEVIRAEQQLVGRLRQMKYEQVLADLPNVTVVEGTGQFADTHRVMVDAELTADRFLIATGSTARAPAIPGLAESGYLTHMTALASERLPESLLVLGGGPLGLEFAQLYARFGSRVTLATKDALLFPRTEPELSQRLEEIFGEEGITVLKGANPQRVSRRGPKKAVTFTTPHGETTEEVEEILVATGKTPNTDTLHLDRAGVQTEERGAVVVNEHYQTSAAHIYGAGDVTSLPRRLEPTAGKEGSFAAENALTGARKTIDYRTVPWTVFTDPQLAGVGLLDAEVGRYGLTCTCSTVSFEHVPKAHILGDTRRLIKMVMDITSRRIVGIHILSANAGDLIGLGELVVKRQMTVDEVLETLPVFPTLSESIKIAALSLVTDVTKLSCCV